MSYVIMRGGASPIAIIIPTPVAIRKTRKECNAWIASRKYPNEYYIRNVKDSEL